MGDSKEELLSYDANCHCGAVRFTVKIPSLDTYDVCDCNCSICVKNGYLLVYPLRKNITWHTPYEELKDYRFASKKWPQKFCGKCGSSVGIDFDNTREQDDLAINIRMFKDMTPEKIKKLKYEFWDGMNELGEPYKV